MPAEPSVLPSCCTHSWPTLPLGSGWSCGANSTRLPRTTTVARLAWGTHVSLRALVAGSTPGALRGWRVQRSWAVLIGSKSRGAATVAKCCMVVCVHHTVHVTVQPPLHSWTTRCWSEGLVDHCMRMSVLLYCHRPSSSSLRTSVY